VEGSGAWKVKVAVLISRAPGTLGNGTTSYVTAPPPSIKKLEQMSCRQVFPGLADITLSGTPKKLPK
jgi:hypothetical protein